MAQKRFKIIAIIYDKRGRILSVGRNNYLKTHPLQAKHARLLGNEERKYLHAEIHAITLCRYLGRAHRISVTRHNSNGDPALAAPCPICASAIRSAGIKIIEHT